MKTKVVGFCGQSSFFLPYTLARTARLLDKKVCFVDLSEEGVAAAITRSKVVNHEGEATDRGVSYFRNTSHGIELDWETFNQFDYVFLYFGVQGVNIQCEELYVVVDGTPASIEYASSAINAFSQRKKFVISSYTDLDGRIDNAISKALPVISEYEVTTIKLTEGDAEAVLSVTLGDTPRLRTISDGVMEFVRSFFADNYDARRISNALKQVYKK